MCTYTQAVAAAGISTTRAPGVPATAVIYDEYCYHDYRARYQVGNALLTSYDACMYVTSTVHVWFWYTTHKFLT